MSVSPKNNAANHFPLARTIFPSSVPRYDFHMHTSWTDGENSVVEMHNAAIEAGMSAILFSEHSRKTSATWFTKFANEVRSLSGGHCNAFVGAEIKVLDFEGNLDTTFEILDCVDLVMGVVHRFPGEEGDIHGTKPYSPEVAVDMEFHLASAILDNPAVDILGHPFGMSFRRFDASPPDELIKALIEKAAKNNIAFEINTQYHPEPWKIIRWCQEADARISLGSNAHSIHDVGKVVRILEGSPCT
jgi:histidinol phosphatase-like PHP family hydrolase